MEIQENAFTEALLDEIEDQWENFLNQASCHFHPELDEHCLTDAEFDAKYGKLPW